MQIVKFPASIAVLLLAALFFLGRFAELHCSPSSQQEINASYFREFETSVEEENTFPNKSILTSGSWLNARQAEELLLIEGGEELASVDCCPSITVMTAPVGGVNTEGNYVQLYRDSDKRQQFYEVSCREEIVDKPCRFMEKRFHNRSRCVQKYSYSYAIVLQEEDDETTKPPTPPLFDGTPTPEKYMLDYIRVRSGCSCEIAPNKKLKDKKNFKNKKKKRKPVNEGD